MTQPDDADDETSATAATTDTAPERRGWRGWMRRRDVKKILEWGGLLALALVVALVLRTFVVQSFYIPSESMLPTLQVEDRVLVNKLAYRFGDPSRGDVVVFEAPPGQGANGINDLIKRVVALPDETVEVRGGSVFVDGERLDEPWLDAPMDASHPYGPVRIPADHYFVMGDNRGDSRDSRVFGPIDEDLIVGKAFIRIWPLSEFGGI